MDDLYNKIKTIAELGEIAAELKKRKKKIVHCHGVFDLVHPGHIRHLALAKKEGDILVVTVTADKFVKRGPGRPIFNENLRAETLAALGSVDFVGIDHNPTAVDAIKAIKPDVYVKGQEYENKDKDVTGKIFDEEEAVTSVGGKLFFTDDITFSSSKLINEHLEVYPPEIRKYLRNISEKYPINTIVDHLRSMKKLKILVIGDAIIDQYDYCESMGRSLKAHIVVTRHLSAESFAGGVFATANNIAGLCGEVHLVSVLGTKDSHENFVKDHLKPNITTKYFYKDGVPTTIKRRFVDQALNRKMFQICYMNDDPIAKEQESEIARYVEKIVGDFDLVVISDFGHGLLGNILVKTICAKAKFLTINAQTNSANTGFNLITKYPRADYISIDEPEIRLAAHEKHLDLEDVMKKISENHDYNNLTVTRGSNGSIFYSSQKGFHESPALASKVFYSI